MPGPLLGSVAAGVLCLVMAMASTAAQRLPAGLRDPLRLDAAIEYAVKNNYAIKRAEARLRQRGGELEHADRLVPTNPRLQVRRAERDRGEQSFNDLGIQLAQEIWIAGQGGLRESAASARVAAARAELSYLKTAVAARARSAFLEVVVAKRAVATAERTVELVQENRDYAKRRLQTGEATRMELNTAEIGLARARSALAQARNRRTRARLRLAEILTTDPTQALEVRGQVRARALELPERSELLNRAVRRRDDLAAAGQRVAAAREALELSERRLIPNLTVFGFYEQEANQDIAGAGVSFDLPLLHRFEGERQAASARLRQAAVERDALELNVRREVLTAVADYRAARERVTELGTRMLANASENLKLIRKAFQAGKVGAPAITTAQNNLLDVRDERLSALRALVRAATDLERATGGLLVMGELKSADQSDVDDTAEESQ